MKKLFFAFAILTMLVSLACGQNVKDYVYLGSRLIATESSSQSISPVNWTLPATASSSSVFINATPGSAWTVTTTTSWIHLQGVVTSSGDGQVQFTFDANTTSVQRIGTIKVGSLTETITQLASNPPAPTNISFAASPTSGADSTFTFLFSSGGGPTYINWFQGLINSSLSTAGACHFIYGATEDFLTLGSGSNTGNPFWYSRARPGQQTILDNQSTCSIDASTITKTVVNATTISLTMKIHFYPVMTGTRYVYMYVSDNAGVGDTNSWEYKGNYVPYPSGVPSVGTVTPSNGAGANVSFATQFIDAAGANALTDIFLMVSSLNTPTVNNSCWIYYNAAFALMSDTSVTWMGPDSSGNVENSQCKLLGTGSSIVRSGNVATMTTNVAFKSAFAGTRYLWVWAQDTSANNTGWVSKGTWTVPPVSGVSVSISPQNGFPPPYFLTVSQAVTFVATVSGSSNTAVTWTRSLNGGPLQMNGMPSGNSYAINTFSSIVPQIVTLTATSVADPSVSTVIDISLIPDGSRPYAMTAAPISSNITMGNYVTYSMTVSNGGGASNMRWVQPQLTWVSPETFLGFNTQPSSNGCHVLYDVSTNTLFLDNESGNSVWISSGPIGGTAPPIGNSVCTIDLQNSTVSVPANSNTMQLNLKVKLETGFPGTIENIFLSAANNNITLDPSWYLGWWWMGPNGIIR